MLRVFSVAFILLISGSYQQDDSTDDDYSDDNDSLYCSFISGEGCMNGICKFCALCVPSDCILATPYSTGNNDGSTCAVTNQENGYDFYNYCLSSGSDDGDCNTSTQCYPYHQGNHTIQYTRRNLTCDQSTCQLIMKDGSSLPDPEPLLNNSNSTTYHPTGSSSSGYINPHSDARHKFDLQNNSPAIIALTSISVFAFLCFLILLIRIVFFKTKYWTRINKYLFCGVCSSPPRRDRPPSFHTFTSSQLRRSYIETQSIHSHTESDSDFLPSYHRQDPSLPKYEQAIVTQIRGLRLSIGSSSSSSAEQQPIWVPVYVSRDRQNDIHVSSPIFNSLFSGNTQDWAAPRHRTIVSTEENSEDERPT